MLTQLVAVIFLLSAPLVYTQTVYMAGDSTMAKGGGGSGSDGQFLSYCLCLSSGL